MAVIPANNKIATNAKRKMMLCFITAYLVGEECTKDKMLLCASVSPFHAENGKIHASCKILYSNSW
jgi:hypothetical protein